MRPSVDALSRALLPFCCSRLILLHCPFVPPLCVDVYAADSLAMLALRLWMQEMWVWVAASSGRTRYGARCDAFGCLLGSMPSGGLCLHGPVQRPHGINTGRRD